MKGIIAVNPFGVPKESVYQAERLKSEFENLGVSVRISLNGYLKNAIAGGDIVFKKECDFAVYLDKDKYLSACMEKSGVRLFNSHEAIRKCDDKGETYIALAGSGLNIPKTVFAPVCYSDNLSVDESALADIAATLNYPVIVKESYGSMGKGVFKADNFTELKTCAEKVKLKPHLFQEYLPFKVGTDVRMIVVGGKFLCAMLRENAHDFRSNVALGGVGKKFCPPEEFAAVAEKCAAILGLDYCGVDLLFGKNSEPFVCEVNSNAFIGEAERVTGVNVARAYAEHIVKEMKK